MSEGGLSVDESKIAVISGEVEALKERWRAMVNEIGDICNTAVVTDLMTADQVIRYYQSRLDMIYRVARYPD